MRREQQKFVNNKNLSKRAIGYWAATGLVAAELIVGGIWDLIGLPFVVETVTHLGYPVYVLNILGVWKLLGAAALLAPRFPRLKSGHTPAQSSI